MAGGGQAAATGQLQALTPSGALRGPQQRRAYLPVTWDRNQGECPPTPLGPSSPSAPGASCCPDGAALGEPVPALGKVAGWFRGSKPTQPAVQLARRTCEGSPQVHIGPVPSLTSTDASARCPGPQGTEVHTQAGHHCAFTRYFIARNTLTIVFYLDLTRDREVSITLLSLHVGKLSPREVIHTLCHS